MLPEMAIVLEFNEETSDCALYLYCIPFALLFKKTRYKALAICIISINNKPNSMILIKGLIDSKNNTILLKAVCPENNTKLFIK